MSQMVFDDYQKKVLDAENGYFLVLAPPGCGKTELLSHRIYNAHSKGIPFSEMLCLTFTNRASRGMAERIRKDGKKLDGLFVGNLHRFSSHFLFENKIVHPDSSIIDDSEINDILDELGIRKNFNDFFVDELLEILQIRDKDEAIKQISHDIKQRELGQTDELLLYKIPRFNIDEKKYVDEENLALYKTQEKLFDLAESYNKYKIEHNLLDFDDLLILTYNALLRPDKEWKCTHYKWIQIDEVQDLNPLQLAIVDALTDKNNPTVVYLGDEQQAIFSFMGAKIESLEKLSKRCSPNILHLQKNYRSPKYLLDIFNEYAEKNLKIDRSLLPQPKNEDLPKDKFDLCIRSYDYMNSCHEGIPKAVNYFSKYPDERLAIIVNSNKVADDISNLLAGTECYKISGQDMFKSESFKTLISHFSVFGKETNFIEWSRIFHKLGVTLSFKDARNLMNTMKELALSPLDFLDYKETSYVQEFYKIYKNEEFVIFDTETTGLNVFEDDIVQIAAIKVRKGAIVDGSNFNIFLKTEKEIPSHLGDQENPLIEEYKKHPHIDRKEGLLRFLRYVGNEPILGHNVNYDYNILKFNLIRDCNLKNIDDYLTSVWDSLKLMRLVSPKLKVYKLKCLLKELNLEGKNSHLADDDIEATRSVVNYIAEKCKAVIPKQCEFLNSLQVKNYIEKFRNVYSEMYNHTRSCQYNVSDDITSAFSVELKYIYDKLIGLKVIKEIPKIQYFLDFLDKVVIDHNTEPHLKQQIENHIVDIKTFSEADLCDAKDKDGNNIIKEKIFVMTVHKAKGLEFENVIVYGAVDGIYPFWKSKKNPEQREEDARKLYVAISRSKKRLCILTWEKIMNYGKSYDVLISPFLKPIKERFEFFSTSVKKFNPMQNLFFFGK